MPNARLHRNTRPDDRRHRTLALPPGWLLTRWLLPGWLVALALALIAGPALAQTQVWRCGADSRTFSDRPCADGIPLTLAPAPDATRVQQAREVAEREAVLAGALRAERLAQEEARRAQLQAEERARRVAQRQAARDAARAQAQARRELRGDERGPARGASTRGVQRSSHPSETGHTGNAGLRPGSIRQAVSAATAPRPAAAGTSP